MIHAAENGVLLPHLVVYARCPRCQTWVYVAAHSERECQRWMTLRSDPSHEHRWHFIDAKATACLDCHALGEIQYPIPPASTEATP